MQAGKVLVAMSGGVDSAVAAFLVKQQGYEAVGANMRFWEYSQQAFTSEPSQKSRITSCCSPEDMGDAERSARGLGIPFYALKMESDFRRQVIDPFISDYMAGRTPNPCVLCNTFIKFGDFYQKANALGFDKIATGHYARVGSTNGGRYAIYPAKDRQKDQAYYLYGLSQGALAQTIFPLADLNKNEVRQIAAENKIPVAQKPESQEICFIPENNYRNFLKKEGVPFQKGYLRNTEGNILAKHSGKENYTVGQRKGLNLAVGHALYVLEICDDGDVIVGTRDEMTQTSFSFDQAVYQGVDESFEEARVMVQIRYNGEPAPATIRRIEANKVLVEMDEPAWAITPGQAAVCYDEDEGFILVGGKISRLV